MSPMLCNSQTASVANDPIVCSFGLPIHAYDWAETQGAREERCTSDFSCGDQETPVDAFPRDI